MVCKSVLIAGSRDFIVDEVSKMNSQRCGGSATVWAEAHENEINVTNATNSRSVVNFFREKYKGFMILRKAGKAVAFSAIMTVQIFGQCVQRVADHANEIRTTRHGTAEATHDVALGEIIRHDQYFAVALKTVRCAFDQVVSGLAAVGK